MEKAQDTTLVGRKVRTVYQTVHSGYEDLLDTAGKEHRRGKLNCVRLALIEAIFSHQTAWLK